ncbi:hypothetical protein B0H14DRAFT_2990388, partial [Mycena olivaceomarginata]
ADPYFLGVSFVAFTSQSVESDTDDQMIIHIPFTGSVKLCSLLRKTSSTDQTPLKVVLLRFPGYLRQNTHTGVYSHPRPQSR